MSPRLLRALLATAALAIAFDLAASYEHVRALETLRPAAERGDHCGCPAYAGAGCNAPCSNCCAPGACPMTGPCSSVAPVQTAR